VMPRFALFMTIALLAAIGLPGSLGFIAELHTIIGGIRQWGWLWLFFCVGLLINAAYAVRTIGLLFTGPVKPQMRAIADLTRIELMAAGIVVAGCVLFGLWPTPLIELSAATINQLNNVIMLRALPG
jgi:NADH-quinone oxidoreductase subunit M